MILKNVDVVSVDTNGHYNRLLISLKGITGDLTESQLLTGDYDNFIITKAKTIAVKEYNVNPKGIIAVDYIEQVFANPPAPKEDNYTK